MATVLDWRKHPVGKRAGKCRHCGGPAWMRDERGKSAHKVCAELDIDRRAAAAVRPTKGSGAG